MVQKALDIDSEIEEAEKALSGLKSKRAAIYNEIQPIMGTNAYATITMDDDSVFGVKLYTPMKRAKFDEESFKNDHPDLYDEFSVTTLDTTSLGKKHKEMKTKYTLPAEPNPKGQPSLEIYKYTKRA